MHAVPLFWGCGPESPEAVASGTGGDKSLIGVSFDSFVIERWQHDRDVFVSAAGDLGAEVNVQNANGNRSEQIAQSSTSSRRAWTPS